MAYQIGTVTSAADLAAAINNFAVANGWSLASGVISKNGCHVRITSPSSSQVKIEGARNGNFSGGDLCANYSQIRLTAWPSSAQYFISGFSTPDTIWCTLKVGTVEYHHMGFGNVQKYGTWGGGMWFHGQHTSHSSSSDNNVASLIDGSHEPYFTTSATECGLFWGPRGADSWNGNPLNNFASNLLCDLRGYIWEPPWSTDQTMSVQCPKILSPIHKNNPNVFNGQTVLTPFQLFLKNTDGYHMSIGHVEHVRFVKLTNYNAEDIVEIASDRWKVFPLNKKDVLYPNGSRQSYSTNIESTGVLGFAVRYDGP